MVTQETKAAAPVRAALPWWQKRFMEKLFLAHLSRLFLTVDPETETECWEGAGWTRSCALETPGSGVETLESGLETADKAEWEEAMDFGLETADRAGEG